MRMTVAIRTLSNSIQVGTDKQKNTEIYLDASVEAGSDDNHVPCYQDNDREPYAPTAYGNLKKSISHTLHVP